jgi:DNA-binding CsgD family transcriptional regulator
LHEASGSLALDWPLTGRDVTLRRLVANLVRNDGHGVLLVGDEGVGKTRLALELAEAARQAGRAVEIVQAAPSSVELPFAALAHLLAVPLASAGQPQLMATLLAELRQRTTPAGPLVLLVDDVQHLDEQSAIVIQQAAVHAKAWLVMTLQRAAQLPLPLTSLLKDHQLQHIEVGPLTRHAADQLIERALGGPVTGLTRGELWRRSRGNPLYLREIIAGGLDAGTLSHEGGIWRAEAGALAPSGRLGELVRQRLGRLTGGQRAVVEAIAVADVVDLAVADAIGGAGAVEALEQRQLVSVERSGNRVAARFRHPLYGEVVAAGLAQASRRRIMLVLADHLERAGARRVDDVLRLALWRLDGGGSPSGALLVSAAGRALAMFDAGLAERLARAAVSNAGAPFAAHLLLGRALAGQQRVEEADAELTAAGQCAATGAEIAQAALARANMLYFRAGRMAEAASVLAGALAKVGEGSWRDEIESLLTLFRAAAGELPAVAAAGQRLIEREDVLPRALVHTLVYSSIANIMLGHISEARRHVAVGLRYESAVGEELPLSGQMLRINAAIGHAYAGELRRGLELGRAGHKQAADAGADELAAMWGMTMAESQLLVGQVEASLRSILGALVITRRRDPFWVRGIAASVACIAACWLARPEQARQLWREVNDNDLARDVRTRIWFDRATLWLGWATGSPADPVAAAVDAARRAERDTHHVWAAWLLHDALRLGADQATARTLAEELQRLAADIEGGLVAAMAHHAAAMAAGDGVGLERAASDFDRLDSRLFAAEAAAHAQRVYLRAGKERLARVAAARATMLAADCSGVRTPALLGVSSAPLTDREAEVAQLAAAGLPSRELAERLGISVRTVDNHLSEIYAKLGIGGRRELPDVLGVAAQVEQAE